MHHFRLWIYQGLKFTLSVIYLLSLLISFCLSLFRILLLSTGKILAPVLLFSRLSSVQKKHTTHTTQWQAVGEGFNHCLTEKV
jgi:hypothetical protein